MSKACLYNLLVVGKNPNQLQNIEPILTNLLSRFPGRLITLLAEEGQGKVLEEKELDPIPLIGSKTQTQSRMALRVAGYEADKIALTPLPYFIPDFPIILFWLPESIQNPLFEKFYSIASRILVDGDLAGDLKGHLENLAHLTKKKNPVADLAWSRGEGWRTVFREVFSSEGRRVALERCDLVQISYAEGYTLNPLFFQSWLKTILEDKGEKIEFRLIPQKVKHLAAGSILNIQCTSPSNDEFLIYRGEDSLEVTLHFCTQETCEIPMTLYLPNMKRGGAYLSSWVWGGTSKEMVQSLKLLETNR